MGTYLKAQFANDVPWVCFYLSLSFLVHKIVVKIGQSWLWNEITCVKCSGRHRAQSSPGSGLESTDDRVDALSSSTSWVSEYCDLEQVAGGGRLGLWGWRALSLWRKRPGWVHIWWKDPLKQLLFMKPWLHAPSRHSHLDFLFSLEVGDPHSGNCLCTWVCLVFLFSINSSLRRPPAQVPESGKFCTGRNPPTCSMLLLGTGASSCYHACQ